MAHGEDVLYLRVGGVDDSLSTAATVHGEGYICASAAHGASAAWTAPWRRRRQRTGKAKA
jgi:hypothetical protein